MGAFHSSFFFLPGKHPRLFIPSLVYIKHLNYRERRCWCFHQQPKGMRLKIGCGNSMNSLKKFNQ
jgi:hypothetical protein